MRECVLAMEGRWPEAPPVEATAEERQLVRRCQLGEEAAFRELLQQYRGRAVYLAAQILRDRTEAEDVVQEAFLRVFRSIGQFRGQSSFHSWLYRIVVNLCTDRSRRASWQSTVPLDEDWDQGRSFDLGETRLQVEALLTHLSDDMRTTLLLREVVGLSYAEIALELDVPVGTIRSRLSAAREQFRRLWLRMEAGEEAG